MVTKILRASLEHIAIPTNTDNGRRTNGLTYSIFTENPFFLVVVYLVMISWAYIYFSHLRLIAYYEEFRRFFGQIVHNVMVSLGFEPGTGVKETSASCGDLNSELKVFVQIQKRGDPPKTGIHRRPPLDNRNKILFSFKFFHKNLFG